MTEYIERKGMREVLEKASISTRFADIPKTADVRPERHGEWLDSESPLTSSCKCSLCSCYFESETPYCPKCGAKMDGGKNNETD